MNFFKRATISITRKPVKALILLALVFFLGTIIVGAISVSNAINNTDANLRRRMRPIVSISMDGFAFEQAIKEEDLDRRAGVVTPEIVRTIGALEYIHYYDYVLRAFLNSFVFNDYDQRFPLPSGVPRMQRLLGTSNTELVQINQGIIELVDGRQFAFDELITGTENRSVAIISDAFARTNDLALGSIFELYHLIRYPEESEAQRGYVVMNVTPEWWADEYIYEKIVMEFEVIGLFDIPIEPELTGDDLQHANLVRRENLNMIYVPNWSIEVMQNQRAIALLSAWEQAAFEIIIDDVAESLEQLALDVGSGIEDMWVESLFILEDPAYLEAFIVVATQLLPTEFHYFNDLFSDFDAISVSLVTLQNISNWILYGSVYATVLILSLIITLFLHDRRAEIGIYLALGEKKIRIVVQILMEVIVIAFVGISLAVFTGHQISGVISQNMIQSEMADQLEERPRPWDDVVIMTGFDWLAIPPTLLSADQMMVEFDVSLNVAGVISFYMIGLGTVMLSAVIPVVYVVRLKPKKVLL